MKILRRRWDGHYVIIDDHGRQVLLKKDQRRPLVNMILGQMGLKITSAISIEPTEGYKI